MKKRTLTFIAFSLLVAPVLASAQNQLPVPPEPIAANAVGASEEIFAEVVAFPGSLAQSEQQLRQVLEDQDITKAGEFALTLVEPRSIDRAQLWLEQHTGFLGARASAWVRELLPWLGFELRSAEQQALVHYALGCLQSEEGLGVDARNSFKTAIYLAPGPVRLDATYNLGCESLKTAEGMFDQIPEVHGRTRSAMSPGFQAAKKKLADDEEEPDYLVMARTSYKVALRTFTERLKLDWRSPDTRANVEWVMRRLDELDKIEEERKSDEGQGQAQDDPSAGEGEEEENKDDAGEKGAESEQEEESESQKESKEESEQDESKEQGQTEDRQEESEDEESSQKQGESEDDPEAKPEERHLTEEEIKRLLEQSSKHDAAGVDMRKRVESRQRKRGKKDW
ncbi:MAG: hypothetical protein JKY61_03545 [Planctomycetes bacterium]|nr:hypothetical protein [Planctomycetota bacterium]